MPWWLNPWHHARDLRRTLEHWVSDCQKLDRQNMALAAKAGGQSEVIATLQRELQQAYAALMPPGGAPMEPEFCLVGIPRPDGSKRVMASRSLVGTSLSTTPEDMAAAPRWQIKAIMDNMLVIDGDGYGEALDKLVRIWANWAAEDKALSSGNRELPEGKGS